MTQTADLVSRALEPVYSPHRHIAGRATTSCVFASRALLQTANTNNGKDNDKGQGKCNGTTYIIKSGDTLSQLAAKALKIEKGCSVEKLTSANPQIKDADVITAGAKLCLPLGCQQPE